MKTCKTLHSALKITLVGEDNLDENYPYYLYEVENAEYHYYLSKTKDEPRTYQSKNWRNKYQMYERKDFSQREFAIAKYLFQFLWNSSNGTNTGCDQDIYEDDGFTAEEIETFITKFNFEKLGVLEFGTGDENSVEIYWDYFSCFDLKSCDMFA